MKIFVTVCLHTILITPIQLASKIVAFCCVFQLSEQDFVRTDFGLKFYILQTPTACTSFDNCTHAANLTSNAVLWGWASDIGALN